MTDKIHTIARGLLASIRLVNGAVGLLAPQLITRQLGTATGSTPGTHYVLRMFGVRTMLIAIDLMRPAGQVRDHAIRVAPIIHASDAIAATLAARTGRLPTRAARSIVAISSVNTVLALLMQPPRDDDPRN